MYINTAIKVKEEKFLLLSCFPSCDDMLLPMPCQWIRSTKVTFSIYSLLLALQGAPGHLSPVYVGEPFYPMNN